MRFDAASVKFSADQAALETRPTRTIGRFRWKTQLLYLLGYAYRMEWWRISERSNSGAVSVGSIYEVQATTGADATEDQERLMLQTLLIERFKIVSHRETKEAVQGYALTVTRDGPKMGGGGRKSFRRSQAVRWMGVGLRTAGRRPPHRGTACDDAAVC